MGLGSLKPLRFGPETMFLLTVTGFLWVQGASGHPLAKQNQRFPMVFQGLGSLKHPVAKQNIPFPIVFHGFRVSQASLGQAKPKFSYGFS